MAEFYTNLPPKEMNELDKTVEKLTSSNYETEYQFAAGDYDSTIAFFVKRGFSRTAAESTTYAILSQAKIDDIKGTTTYGAMDEAAVAKVKKTINKNKKNLTFIN